MRRRLLLVAAALALAAPARAQEAPLPPAWRDSAPLALTVVADVKQLQRDDGASPPWRPATVQVEGMAQPAAARVRARGNWRRKNCYYPPLRLDVGRKAAKGTALEGLDRPKVVVACKGGGEQERLILQEFQLYRVWQALSPLAHEVRLVRLSMRDRGDARPVDARWAILVEEGEALAKRLGARELDQKGTAPGDLQPVPEAVLGLFQYMIGNTDWSLSALHNVELMARDLGYFAVPYDFDWSGAVDAPYAIPAPELGIRSVRERRYRGYCVPQAALDEAIAHVKSRRPAIEALYRDDLGRLLPERAAQATLEYFAGFWAVLDDPRQVKRHIVEGCRR